MNRRPESLDEQIRRYRRTAHRCWVALLMLSIAVFVCMVLMIGMTITRLG